MSKFYIDEANRAKSFIISSNELFRFAFPLNFVVDLSENDDLVENGADKSIEKEIRNTLFIYFKLFKLFNEFLENEQLYHQLIKSEVEYFLMRYRIVFDIIDKHLIKSINIDRKKIETTIYNSDEFLQLKSIRNKLAHEGLRCHIFQFGKDPQLSFQIYDAGTLEDNIILPEIFMDKRGSHIYFLQHYITWLIAIMFNFLQKYFIEIQEIRLNGGTPSQDTLETIQFLERGNNHPLSRITFLFGELLTLQEGLDKFIAYVEQDT
ncbi:hypothetical protein [Paenibacillus durus]|uniref:Uncharacterized protein n=1 Tax=Paenibacillus durus TaxID=44251 RepID=A0A089HJT8_PAEDU|nr:hypothetical protein [Paenibacillus durus]AIQ11362.1 hypothetical protein PDUR_04695 [Paenibacillus durus]